MKKSVDRASVWIYQGLWRILVSLFRVPEAPPGLPCPAGEELDSFRPAPGFLAYLKFWFWIVLTLVDGVIVLAWLATAIAVPWLGACTFPLMLLVAVVPDIIAYIAIHLRYDTTWYVMSSRSLRIRRGIWSIHEVTITYENVQNVSVAQGPVERCFGIATVVVDTAGGGAPAGQHGATLGHQGVLEGIANAASIRDLILSRIRASRTAGLGDESPAAQAASPAQAWPRSAWSPHHLEVLRQIRDELGRLDGQAFTRSNAAGP